MSNIKYAYIVFAPDSTVDRVFNGIDSAREYVKKYYGGVSSGDMISHQGIRSVWRELWKDENSLGNIVIEKHVVY